MAQLFRKKNGFTLIEVLIVILIIAVLAALLLPQLLKQPERAATAEALQMLGALRRAQSNYQIASGAYLDVTRMNDANWQKLGLGNSTGTQKFSYSCVAATGICTATNVNTAANKITIDIPHGMITCEGGYKPVTSSSILDYSGNNAVVGCSVG